MRAPLTLIVLAVVLPLLLPPCWKCFAADTDPKQECDAEEHPTPESEGRGGEGALPPARLPADAPSGTPYEILGVPADADKEAIVKAYRQLSRRWHPDRNRGAKEKEEAKLVFPTIARAYEVLLDAEQREIFDRLGESGLQRLRDGDPSVKKGWLPPDEVLRRVHNDGEEPLHQWLVTTLFAALSSMLSALRQHMLWLSILFGLEQEFPSVHITATDASGQQLASGADASSAVTFKFQLSGKSVDFTKEDVTHNCRKSKFLGMKTTFYLECQHKPGAWVEASVAAQTFTVLGKDKPNKASPRLRIRMV